MWSSIENLKQNLNKIALDVHDDDDVDELEIYPIVNGDDSPVSDRRNSHSSSRSKSVSRYPMANGIDSPNNSEIEQYKAEIRRLLDSEAELKALSVNYAAMVKQKEDQISRLNQENGSLKQNLDATREALNVSRNDSATASPNSTSVIKGLSEQSPKRQHKSMNQVKNRGAGSHMQNGVMLKEDGISNGTTHTVQPDVIQSKMGKEKGLADLLEDKKRALAAMEATHELKRKQVTEALERERDKLVNVQLKLQEEQKLNESFQEELRILKMEKKEFAVEMNNLRAELNEKILEIRRLQTELSRWRIEDGNENEKSLKRVIAALKKENTNLKISKNELEAALEMNRNSVSDKASVNGEVNLAGSFPGKEEMEQSLQKVERDFKEACHARDKALQELSRLKQHLLEKESEESEKMDEDSKIIEELRENNENQKAQILQLEKTLKQAIACQEEVRMTNNNEIYKSKEIIEDLNKKLANCMSIIESKNVELLNLQTALGQYFAEIEAKEHLEQELASAREESTKLSELLKGAEQGTEALKRDKEEISTKLSHTERMMVDGKNRVNKLEEDNAKLRRALEQSMTRLNRMSMDSDFLVDRRIVIKLLVTYFQRNHSKEVLDLMVRMLGFSDEDKQRIGLAQQGGKGVVRGVLGLPGRLVGGILGGSSAESHANAASENQSFADLWVDYLLKEAEEREKKEAGETTNAPEVGLPLANSRTSTSAISGSKFSPVQYGPPPSQGSLKSFEHSDSEFSTVPLTSFDSNSRISQLLTKP